MQEGQGVNHSGDAWTPTLSEHHAGCLPYRSMEVGTYGIYYMMHPGFIMFLPSVFHDHHPHPTLNLIV